MTENDISYKIRGAAYNVYKELGSGSLESVYEEALYYELQQIGLKVERQLNIPIEYKGIHLSTTLRLDLIVEDKVIIELKSVAEISNIHFKQLQTYLKLTNKRLGLLINFNTTNILDDIHRVVNGL